MQNAEVAQQQGQSDLATQIRQQVRQQVQEAQRSAQEAQRTAQEAQRAAQEATREAMQQAGQPNGQSGTLVPPFPPPAPMEAIPPQVFDIVIFFFITVAVIIIGLPIARALGRRLDRKPYKQALDPGITTQLQRIENTVDSMSIEIERISEAQRYMARLQTEHADPTSLPRADSR
jgi:hypothetical protein